MNMNFGEEIPERNTANKMQSSQNANPKKSHIPIKTVPNN